MKINRDNYEAFFLDYFEGRLNSHECSLLMAFLEDHPDLREEFSQFDMVMLEPELQIHFHDKASLKKNDTPNVDESNYNQWIIAEMEGELTDLQESELKLFLQQNPEYQAEKELFLKTHLQPDISITFKHKDLLYHTDVIHIYRRRVIQIASIAASVALIIGVSFMFWGQYIFQSPVVQMDTMQHNTRQIIEKRAKTNRVVVPEKEQKFAVVKSSEIHEQQIEKRNEKLSQRIEPPKSMKIIELNEIKDEHNNYYFFNKRFEALSLNEMALMANDEIVPNIQDQIAEVVPSSSTTIMGNLLNKNGEISEIGNTFGEVTYKNLQKVNNFKETVIQGYLKLENTINTFFGK